MKSYIFEQCLIQIINIILFKKNNVQFQMYYYLLIKMYKLFEFYIHSFKLYNNISTIHVKEEESKMKIYNIIKI